MVSISETTSKRSYGTPVIRSIYFGLLLKSIFFSEDYNNHTWIMRKRFNQIERWIGHPRKMVIRDKITIEDKEIKLDGLKMPTEKLS